MRLFSRQSSVGLLSLMTVLAAHSALAQTPATAPASEFEAKLKRIDAKSGNVVDLTADFEQEKKSPLLRKPLASRGTIAAKGSNSLWNTTAPQPTAMASDPTALRLYFPDRKIVEEYPIRSQLGMMAASPLPSLDAIEKSFTVAPDTADGLADANSPRNVIAVRLNPKDDQIKQYVDHVRVLLDAERGLVLAFEMTDPDGEITLIHFSNIRTDTGLPDSAVQLKLPSDVKTVHPLGDTEAGHP